ncbi:Type IV pilus biogenesis and competence protein PilQ [Sporomusa silvacetica DSM 10669]|uniref:Type IV pilus biogenesis and competence protein PilQ n=1 Tax=Sporomusa silvacetica DSM 10669 TaxID=1123289 RepID=A0ABZ3IK23_9FIRM|nr:secretin N-terminal domain-containing protein [Sporomusa silvacetica]OZC18645.1 type IV pilus biogenesis and competence protein PilQ precursor [Sporomusa silvacetica DSM 10669]
MRCLIKSILVVLWICFSTITGVAVANPQVNMNVTNGEVRDVLTALATVGKVNMVMDDSVKGTITIQLTNIPYDSALDLVCKTKGLTYQLVDDVMVVGVADQIGRGFGSVHIFKLKFINPDSVKDTILSILFGEKKGEKATKTVGSSANSQKSTTASAASTSGETASEKSTELDRLTIDYATNSLVLFGTEAEAAQIQKLLSELDVPYQQVSLEAEVLAISKDKTKDLGIEWSWEATPQYAERTTDDNGDVTVTRTGSKGVIQFGRNPEGNSYEFYYQATINALISNGDAKVLAKPKVTTINGKQAQILIGDRIPVQVQTLTNGTTTTSTEYIDAGIKLIYTPRINTDGLLTVDVRTEVSSATLVPDIKAYKITTRQAETTVRLKDGETMVIGGLIGSTDSEAKKAVPFFSDLPIIGSLFKNFNKSHNDTEVVIFLTPRIVK